MAHFGGAPAPQDEQFQRLGWFNFTTLCSIFTLFRSFKAKNDSSGLLDSHEDQVIICAVQCALQLVLFQSGVMTPDTVVVSLFQELLLGLGVPMEVSPMVNACCV